MTINSDLDQSHLQNLFVIVVSSHLKPILFVFSELQVVMESMESVFDCASTCILNVVLISELVLHNRTVELNPLAERNSFRFGMNRLDFIHKFERTQLRFMSSINQSHQAVEHHPLRLLPLEISD